MLQPVARLDLAEFQVEHPHAPIPQALGQLIVPGSTTTEHGLGTAAGLWGHGDEGTGTHRQHCMHRKPARVWGLLDCLPGLASLLLLIYLFIC